MTLSNVAKVFIARLSNRLRMDPTGPYLRVWPEGHHIARGQWLGKLTGSSTLKAITDDELRDGVNYHQGAGDQVHWQPEDKDDYAVIEALVARSDAWNEAFGTLREYVQSVYAEGVSVGYWCCKQHPDLSEQQCIEMALDPDAGSAGEDHDSY